MNYLMELAKYLQPSDLPGQMEDVAELCGVDTAVSLIVNVSGLDIYVPSSGHKICKEIFIRNNYTGKNSMSLAVKLGMDSSEVRKIAEKETPIPEVTFDNVYMKFVVAECGKAVALSLMEHFSSVRIRVPQSGLVLLKKIYVEKYFDGTNVPELALKLRLSESCVRKVIAESYRSHPFQQLDLFRDAAAV